MVALLAAVAVLTAVVCGWGARRVTRLDREIQQFDTDRAGAFIAPSVETILLNPAAAAMGLHFKVIEVYVMSMPIFTNPRGGQLGGMDGSVIDRLEAFVLCTNGVVHQLFHRSSSADVEAAAQALAGVLRVPFEYR